MAGHETAVGLQAEDHRVEEDDADDEMLDAGRFDPFGQVDSPGFDVLAFFEVYYVLVGHGFKNVGLGQEESMDRGRKLLFNGYGNVKEGLASNTDGTILKVRSFDGVSVSSEK